MLLILISVILLGLDVAMIFFLVQIKNFDGAPWQGNLILPTRFPFE